jgi:transposase
MQTIYERCGALDVHQASIQASVRLPTKTGRRRTQRASFGTTTPDLLALLDWLQRLGVTHVAMEATGVYWKPVYYVLEGHFAELLVVNAHHVKQVPGRKTDASDADWLCQLLECGLLRGGFVPPEPIRELRDLTRRRKSLTQERQREANRLHKVLEDAGVKLSSVASDVLGVSGRRMLEALCAGHSDPAALADLARGRLRAKLPALEKALTARFRTHHAVLVADILAHLDYLDERIVALSALVAEKMAPYEQSLTLWTSMPGIQRRTAEVLVSELGPALTATFPAPGQLARWCGMAPGNNESAGKRRRTRTTKGNKWVRMALIEAALAAARTRNTFFASHHRRLVSRRGERRALVGLAHRMLTTGWQLHRSGALYQEPDPRPLSDRQRDRTRRRAVRQLEALGFRVTLLPEEASTA